MKITLKNFRCYTKETTFDLGNDGITLLSGGSGAGKTTILMGIYFALFGTGTKLVNVGKKTCTVCIEYKDISIQRTKKPNRLVVTVNKREYEDEAGQNIINNKFGENFKTTGYISQTGKDSFMLMSPIEKLGFLERFALRDINVPDIKKRCKTEIKQRNDILHTTTGKLEMGVMVLKDMSEPEKKYYPLKCTVKNQKLVTRNEIIKRKNTLILIKRKHKEIENTTRELNDLKIYNTIIDSKRDELETIKKKKTKYDDDLCKINYVGDVILDKYKEDLNIIISTEQIIIMKLKYTTDKNKLIAMKMDEYSSMEKELHDIENSIWKEYKKIEINELLSDMNEYIKDIEMINEYKNKIIKYKINNDHLIKNKHDLETYKTELTKNKREYEMLKMQKNIYKCPSCNGSLKFNGKILKKCEIEYVQNGNNKLELINKIIIKIIKNIDKLTSIVISDEKNKSIYENMLKNIENLTNKYEDMEDITYIRNNIKYLLEYEFKNNNMDTQIDTLKRKINNKEYSSTIKTLEKNVDLTKSRLEHIIKREGDILGIHIGLINEGELRDKICKQHIEKEKLANCEYNLSSLKSDEAICKQILEDKYNEFTKIHSALRQIEDVNELLITKQLELSELIKKLNNHEHNISEIDIHAEYIININKYNNWVNNVKTLELKEIEDRNRYAASTTLMVSIIEAESIAMLNVISSINTHTQPYFDSFFPDNPITVKLVPFKETKKGKQPKINIQIEYKGMEADISILSGGELSRLNLAFSLALGEMFNTPIMLLDECTSNLDQELTDIVMDGIRDNYNNKLVIIIAHQVVKGQFDRVIEIK